MRGDTINMTDVRDAWVHQRTSPNKTKYYGKIKKCLAGGGKDKEKGFAAVGIHDCREGWALVFGNPQPS